MSGKKKSAPKARAAKVHVVSFRASAGMAADLDAYLEALAERFPGGNWTRSSAALQLVAEGLAGYKRTGITG